MRVGSAEELMPTLEKALSLDVPSIVEVPIDYSENRKFSMNLADMARVARGSVRQMAMTETVRKLLVDGEWYETGETLDVTSPYDGGGRAGGLRRRRGRPPGDRRRRAGVSSAAAGAQARGDPRPGRRR